MTAAATVAVPADTTRICPRCGEDRYVWEFMDEHHRTWCGHCKTEVGAKAKMLSRRERVRAQVRAHKRALAESERETARRPKPAPVAPEKAQTPRRRRLEVVSKPPALLPWTRGDCRYGQRPCPIVSCRHNNYLEVSSTGMIYRHFKCEPWEVPPGASCSLDIPDRCRGGLTLEAIAEMLGGLTRERIRQIEVKGLENVRKELRRRGLLEDMKSVDEEPFWRSQGGRRR